MWHACAVHHLKDRRKQLAFIQCMLRFLFTVHPQQHHPCFQLVFVFHFPTSSTRPGLREAPSACAAITHNIDNIDAMSSCATGRQGEPSPAKAKAFINITILICKRRPAVVGEGRKKNKRVEASSWSSSQCRRYPNVGS